MFRREELHLTALAGLQVHFQGLTQQHFGVPGMSRSFTNVASVELWSDRCRTYE